MFARPLGPPHLGKMLITNRNQPPPARFLDFRPVFAIFGDFDGWPAAPFPLKRGFRRFSSFLRKAALAWDLGSSGPSPPWAGGESGLILSPQRPRPSRACAGWRLAQRNIQGPPAPAGSDAFPRRGGPLAYLSGNQLTEVDFYGKLNLSPGEKHFRRFWICIFLPLRGPLLCSR